MKYKIHHEKKLRTLVKNKLALLGLSVTLVVLVAGIIVFANKPDHHKVSQASAEQTTAQKASSENTDIAKEEKSEATQEATASTPTPAQSTKPATTPVPAASKPAATTPNIPKQATPTNTQTPYLTRAYIYAGTSQCSGVDGYLGYNYSFGINAYNAGGVISGTWEIVSGLGSVPAFPAVSFAPGRLDASGTVSPTSGFGQRPVAYQIRLHVTAPTDMYSNTLTVPACQ